jgi:hypothetical protein
MAATRALTRDAAEPDSFASSGGLGLCADLASTCGPMSEFAIAIAAAALTVAGTFLVEQWRRWDEARHLKAALAAEMREVRRAIYEETEKRFLIERSEAAGEAVAGEMARPTLRIEMPVFHSTAGSLGMVGSPTTVSHLVRLGGEIRRLPETLALVEADGPSEEGHLRVSDVLLSLWRLARELEETLAVSRLAEVPPRERQLFTSVEDAAAQRVAAEKRFKVTQTEFIRKGKLR